MKKIIFYILIFGFLIITTTAFAQDQDHKRKILYYRNPMNPQVTSPVPIKDSMGMDYAPVYEEEKASGPAGGGVYINPEKQQLIGIKKGKVEKMDLVQQVLAVGRIAYDPDLFVAQEEYVQALNADKKIQQSPEVIVKEQTGFLVEAAKKKLILLGMSEEEVGELEKTGKPDDNLYLPANADTVWAYLSIYENEIGLIKEGLLVEIETAAFPGEVLEGKISAITPVLDQMTRSVQVRAKIGDLGHNLKPGMFINAKIKIDLGLKLAVPAEAVMDTGERQVVFIAKPEGYFQARDVRIGAKAGGYYEVLSGLEEGEEVVSEGNFFIDSESKLKG